MKPSLATAGSDELVAGLNKLFRNLWRSGNQKAEGLFGELMPRGWRNMFHNAAAVLHGNSEPELRARQQSAPIAARVGAGLSEFENYLSGQKACGRHHVPGFHMFPAASYSVAFGFHESLPITASGLGILAGDHAKSASDLGPGFAGVGLFYREGYFQQANDAGA